MKILLLTTNIQGGAGLACKRLLKSLKKSSLDVSLATVRGNSDGDSGIIILSKSIIFKLKYWIAFLIERLYFYFSEVNPKIRYSFSPANVGLGISKKLLDDNDIIHLHWINQGFISLTNLKDFLKSNKKIIWTLHDMWAFTGGCHYAGDCTNYKENCGNCKFVKHPSSLDLSYKTWKLKSDVFQKREKNVVFVACSKWMQKMAQESALLKNFEVYQIPSPIDTLFYKPLNKIEQKSSLNIPTNKIIFLFGAMNLTDERKGVNFLLEAIHYLEHNHRYIVDRIAFTLVGNNADEVLKRIDLFEVIAPGLVESQEKMLSIYNASDFLIIPSVEDNLPNTIVEAMSCGVPVIGFNKGGIPEMIDEEKNGLIADFYKPNSLAEAIIKAVHIQNVEYYHSNARKKALETYSEEVVNKQYIELYNKLISEK